MSKAGFQIDQPTLQRISDRYDLGKIEQVVMAGRGINNPALMINDSLVIRFDGIINQVPSRFHGEKRCYDALLKAGIPAPQVIAVDDSKSLVPYDYMVMSKIEGAPLIDAWPTLALDQRGKLAYQAGQLLARMHNITFDTFGRLYGTERIFDNWYSYIHDTFRRYSLEAVHDGLIQPDIQRRMQLVMEKYRNVFEQVKSASLVHWDYHFENLLQKDGVITGVLDFEWALSGDPAHDFNRRDQWDDDCPGSRAALYDGYTSIRALDTDHDLRVRLYQMIWFIDCVVDAGNEAEAEIMRGELVTVLESLE